jgi:Uncharacterised nucleotidyltransferase
MRRSERVRLSREFELVAACCRRPADAAADARIRDLADGADWPRVAAVARRHRVEGLVWEGLRRAAVDPPAGEAAALKAAAGRIARQNLLLAAESFRLHRLFAAAGIDLLFVKGLTLGQRAWGSIGAKMGWDIDVLVDGGQLADAAALVEREGYALAIPEGPRARETLALWHAHWKESVWVRATDGTTVELHTALADNAVVLKGVGLASPRQEVPIAGGGTLPTLADEPLFAYLAVHGASSAWFRLKWIADVGALLAGLAPHETERLYRAAAAHGAGRAAGLALLLCHRLFATPVDATLLAALRADRATRWMLALSLRKLAGRAESRELEATRLGTATIHLLQLGLKKGLRYKLGELRRQMVSPYDRLAVPLPRGLTFLYPAIFVIRRLRRGSG